MKSNYIKIFIVFLFALFINSVFAQRIRQEEQQEVNHEEQKKFNENERIKDPDLKYHLEFKPDDAEIVQRELSPEEVKLIRPIWVCASTTTTDHFYHGHEYSLYIYNFSHEVAYVRVIFYFENEVYIHGDIRSEYTFENKIGGKKIWEISLDKMLYGAVEIHSNSPDIYPQSFYYTTAIYWDDDKNNKPITGSKTTEISHQWFRVDR